MAANAPSALQRLVLAFYAFFAILFRAEVASAMQRLREARRAGVPALEPAPSALTAPPREAAPAPHAVPPPPPPPVVGSKPQASPPTPPAPVAASKPPPAPVPVAVATPQPALDGRQALHLLSVLQREGRLVDFVEEDLTGFPDAAVGAAARTVHEGCKRALAELFRIEPVLREQEGAVVTVERGFDPAAIRLTGSVVGEPPFRGALRHHGWRALDVRLPAPPAGTDASILAPAEIEL